MRKIVIQQGDEYRAKVETEYEKEAFFAPVYEEAERMIRAIVRDSHERKPKEERKNLKSQSMITDGNNVIVFCGKRGQGKTSAMKTVAYYMENEEIVFSDEKEKLDDKAHFYVLETIDPSSLNEDESIVRVLISKMFNNVVELVNEYSTGTKYREYSEDDIRVHQQELLCCFAECFKNVDYSVKDNKMDFGMDDLELLAQLGSSGKLRERLRELVQRFLAFQSRFGKLGRKYKYMIVQIDDTDMALNGAYKICEDIRNYFSIDNVIVLMATEMEQLSNAIFKQYIERDKALLNIGSDEFLLKNCNYMTARYIEKMFPMGHRIQLPKIQDYLEWNFDKVKVEYLNPNRNQEDFFSTCNDKCNDIQRQLLSVLYDYTGVIFLIKDEMLHPFLPTTMRELTQFLIMLNSMKKVNFEKVYLAEQQEIANLRYNLDVLENYFWNFWGPNNGNEWNQKENKDLLEFVGKRDSDEWIKYFQRDKDGNIKSSDVAKSIILTIYLNKRFVDMAEGKLDELVFVSFISKVIEIWGNTNSDGWHLFHYEFERQKTEDISNEVSNLTYESEQGNKMSFNIRFPLVRILLDYDMYGAKRKEEEQVSVADVPENGRTGKQEAVELSDIIAVRNLLANVDVFSHVEDQMRSVQEYYSSKMIIQLQEIYERLFYCMDIDDYLTEHLSSFQNNAYSLGKECFEKYKYDYQTYREDFMKDEYNHAKMEGFLEDELTNQGRRVYEFIDHCKKKICENKKSSPISISEWSIVFMNIELIPDSFDEKKEEYRKLVRIYEEVKKEMSDFNQLIMSKKVSLEDFSLKKSELTKVMSQKLRSLKEYKNGTKYASRT